MATKYQTVNLGDYAGPVSITHKFNKDTAIFLNTSDIYLGEILHTTYSKVDALPGQAKKTINKSDILFSEIRPANGRWAFVDIDETDDFVVSTKLMVIRTKSDSLHPRFLYYFLTSPATVAWLQVLAESRSGTFPQITFDQVENLELPLPPVEYQVRVSGQIDILDKKMNLNRRINQTLEAMAQALFKSWFVDFDPVKAKVAAKMEGRDQMRAAMSAISGKSDAELGALPPERYEQLAATAALFPDEMEESELGKIPKGWKVQRVGNVLELVYGKALKSTDRQEGSVPVYGSGGITGYHNTPLVQHGSIIVGRKGTVGSLYWEDEPFFPIDTTYYVRPLAAPLTFCYYAMQTLGLEKMNTDAAVPGLNRENVYRLELVLPDVSVLQKFDSGVSTLREAIRAHSKSNKALANLRDSLLPKLLSGELSVEAFAEQAGIA